MYKMITTLFLFLISSVAFAVSGNNNNLDTIVSNNVQAFMTNKGVPGVAVVVYYQGQLHFYNFGVTNRDTQQPVTSDSIFEIGSITKLFTATLLAEEIQNGKMKLQDKVTLYLPPELEKNNGAINQVTLQELATHTSGLPRMAPGSTGQNRADYTNDQFMQYLSTWQPAQSIGSSYNYSNIGYGILGDALASATGKSYHDLLQANIIGPLNMTSTSLNQAVDNSRYVQGYNRMNNPARQFPVNNIWPAGGALRSTTKDLAKFLEANLNLSIASPTLLNAMQLAQQPLYQAPTMKIGMGWQDLPNGIINKNGGTFGFGTAIALYPPKKMGIVILTNRAGSQPIKLANTILEQLAGIPSIADITDDEATE